MVSQVHLFLTYSMILTLNEFNCPYPVFAHPPSPPNWTAKVSGCYKVNLERVCGPALHLIIQFFYLVLVVGIHLRTIEIRIRSERFRKTKSMIYDTRNSPQYCLMAKLQSSHQKIHFSDFTDFFSTIIENDLNHFEARVLG